MKNYGNSRGGGLKEKVPSVRGMDIFWNYTINLVHRPPPPPAPLIFLVNYSRPKPNVQNSGWEGGEQGVLWST